MTEMRRRDLRCPVIAFSTDQDAAARRAALLDLGALGDYFTFEALLRALDARFTPAIDAG